MHINVKSLINGFTMVLRMLKRRTSFRHFHLIEVKCSSFLNNENRQIQFVVFKFINFWRVLKLYRLLKNEIDALNALFYLADLVRNLCCTSISGLSKDPCTSWLSCLLFFFQSDSCFYVYAVLVFRKHCGNEQFPLFSHCFPAFWRGLHHFHKTCIVGCIGVWRHCNS